MDDLEQVKVTVLPGGRMDRRNAAAYLGRRPQTLAHWATRGEGPPYANVRGRAYYSLTDLERFIGTPSAA